MTSSILCRHRLLGRDSVDDFLFETQRGFCEHFASAFTFLMRAAGIPARVVTGYQGGYFNTLGNYLVVRQSDAHAWAEVWLQGRGWVRVDPTGAVSPQRVELGAHAAAGASAAWYQADWLLGLRNQFDLVNRGWNSLIVQFNALRQQSLLTPFGIDKAEYYDLIVDPDRFEHPAAGAVFMVGPAPPARARRSARRRLRAAVPQARTRRRDDAPRTKDRDPSRCACAISPLGLVVHCSICSIEYVSLRYAHALPPAAAVRDFATAVRHLRLSAHVCKN